MTRLFHKVLFVSIAAATALAACNPTPHSSPSSDAKKHSHALTIYGYNYTDRYIDSFDVDGQGGGNMDVSTPVVGGSKAACCVDWPDALPLPQVMRIRWTSGKCVDTVVNSSGEHRDVVINTLKERQVSLTAPIPSDPRYFEVHIYPDEHVEVAITSQPSEPRLRLDESRRVSSYPRCRDGK